MTNVGRLLRQKIEDEKRRVESELGQGCAKDWPEYRYMTGILVGLHLATEMLDEVENEGR